MTKKIFFYILKVIVMALIVVRMLITTQPILAVAFIMILISAILNLEKEIKYVRFKKRFKLYSKRL